MGLLSQIYMTWNHKDTPVMFRQEFNLQHNFSQLTDT